VLRHGRVVFRTLAAETSVSDLARTMIGDLPPKPSVTRAPSQSEVALSIVDITLQVDGNRVLDQISLTLRAGEVAGLAGVDGNGQSEFVDILAGARRADSGQVRVAQSGDALAVVPENRDTVGLNLGMSLWENLLLVRPIRKQNTRRGWIDSASAINLCNELLDRLEIRALGPEVPALSLSGGNRQRLEVARAIASHPKVIVAHNVCRGLDLAGTAEVHQTLADFATAGGAVLLISSDLDELLGVCGRLFVISHGRVRETNESEHNSEKLGLLMAGNWN
jgi:simple sugar transport system ATP-binding protein